MKKIILGVFIFLALCLFVFKVSAGFDEYRYNDTARIFNGTYMDWCKAKNDPPAQWCLDYIQGYEKDKLIMKWNTEWDRGNAENWTNPPYTAWLDNESNGRLRGGSGEIWHYKFVWDSGCAENGTPSSEAVKGVPYCIWGQFAVIQSQGSDIDRTHIWDVLLSPAGYGHY